MPTILVVDDSRHMREFFADSLLRPAGYTVVVAQDGRAGLKAAQECQPDLILADMQMPGLTGLDLKRALNAAGDRTPLLLITAEGSETIASEASLAGVAGYLVKPVDVDLMLSTIEHALTLEQLRRDGAGVVSTLEMRVHQLETLEGLGQDLAQSLDMNQVLTRVVEAATRLTDADAGQLFLLDERDKQLCLRATHGPDENHTGIVHEATADVVAAQAVLRSGAPVRVPLAPTSTAPLSYPVLLVPMRLREHAVGVLSVDNRVSLRVFAEADVGPLSTLAGYAATAIANAQLFAEVQHQSITDSLTGLYTRRHCFALAEREFQRATRFKRPLTAIMLDLDHFKQVNDTYGHATGDQVIAEAARRCRTTIRAIDILGRYGGEEFIFLLPETDVTGARRLAERLRSNLSGQPIEMPGGAVTITASLGIAGNTPELADATALINDADAALYAAKQAGRDCVRVRE